MGAEGLPSGVLLGVGVSDFFGVVGAPALASGCSLFSGDRAGGSLPGGGTGNCGPQEEKHRAKAARGRAIA
jgi:hypothetical protein